MRINVPHDTAPKKGDGTASVTKQLISTTLHYDIQTPNVIVPHNRGRDNYYLHATHERSPITIYTFTTYPGLQPPQYHPGRDWRHPLHIAPAPRKSPAQHAAPPADRTALPAARTRAVAQNQNGLLPHISTGPGKFREATHKSTMNLLVQKRRPKTALEDTLWVYHGESRTAPLTDVRTITPRHIQCEVGPFTIYATPRPITVQCTHCKPRCALPCAGALQQPLPTPIYRGAYTLALYPGTHILTSHPQRTATTPYHSTSPNSWQWNRFPS